MVKRSKTHIQIHLGSYRSQNTVSLRQLQIGLSNPEGTLQLLQGVTTQCSTDKMVLHYLRPTHPVRGIWICNLKVCGLITDMDGMTGV